MWTFTDKTKQVQTSTNLPTETVLSKKVRSFVEEKTYKSEMSLILSLIKRPCYGQNQASSNMFELAYWNSFVQKG